MLKNILLYRMIITNAVGLAFLGWAFTIGYVNKVFERDISHISILIAIVFFVGLFSTFVRTIKVNKLIENSYKDPALIKEATDKNLHLYRMAEWLVTLGLIGNALGFFISLDGLNSDAVSTLEGTKQVASNLLSGMGVAFGSTLVGSITGLWIWVNFHTLEVATNLLAIRSGLKK